MKKVFLWACTMFFTSCSTREIRLKSDSIELSPSMKEMVGFTKASGQLGVLEFAEDKDFSNPVGFAKTGLVGTQTPVYLDGPSREFVRSQFVAALVKRGVEVSSLSEYVLAARITEFKVDEEADEHRAQNAGCTLKLDLTLFKGKSKEKTFKGNISVGFSGTDNVLDATSSEGPLLKACVESAVEKFLADEKIRNLTGIKIKN